MDEDERREPEHDRGRRRPRIQREATWLLRARILLWAAFAVVLVVAVVGIARGDY